MKRPRLPRKGPRTPKPEPEPIKETKPIRDNVARVIAGLGLVLTRPEVS